MTADNAPKLYLVRAGRNGEDVRRRNYERLPAEIQADLPLKRVWVLVNEDSEA